MIVYLLILYRFSSIFLFAVVQAGLGEMESSVQKWLVYEFKLKASDSGIL